MLGTFRFLLALGVLFSHTNVSTPVFGRAMVLAFFLMSGYLMALTLQVNYGISERAGFLRGWSIVRFWWNRYLRLMPLYCLLCIVMIGLFHYSAPLYREYSLLELVLIPGYLGTLVAPGWSLTNEVLFYLLVPLALLLPKPRITIPLLCFASFAVGLKLETGQSFDFPSPMSLRAGPNVSAIILSFGYFFLGSSLYLLVSLRKSRSPFELAGFGLIGALFLFDRSTMDEAATWQAIQNVTGIGIVLITSVMLCFWTGKETRSSKVLGDLCYPIYVIHHPLLAFIGAVGLLEPGTVYRRVVALIPSYFESFFHSLVITLLSVGLGFIWLRFEKRFLGRLRAAPRARDLEIEVPQNLSLKVG